MTTWNIFCCLCGKPLLSRGHDPWPLKPKPIYNSDKCCGACNMLHVVRARLELGRNTTNEQDKDK